MTIFEDVLYKMSKILIASNLANENGMEVDQFNAHPATIATAEAFSKASAGLEEYVGQAWRLLKVNLQNRIMHIPISIQIRECAPESMG